MGAEQFQQFSKDADAQEAFDRAVKQACHNHGHSGCTGTIAEKEDFALIEVPEKHKLCPSEFADKLLHDCDDRIDDKWGPAGCVEVPVSCWDDTDEVPLHVIDTMEPVAGKDRLFLFFGWASC